MLAMELDHDDPRPPYIQIANALRAAILTRNLAPGERLPSGADLAKNYGVSRMTVSQALRVLRAEDLVVSRQGSGVFVRERTKRPIELRPHIERAFNEEHVFVDFAGFTSETLHGAIQEPLDKIRIGRFTPRTIQIRILVTDPSQPWTLPCAVDDLADDPAFRRRSQRITARNTEAIIGSLQELANLKLVEEASAQVRMHHSAPLFVLYLINKREVFFGFYPIMERELTIEGEPHKVYDLRGKEKVLFHHEADGDRDSISSQYVGQAMTWFESMWSTVSRDAQRD
jgi:DNA-binding transcriptional regulator YhcF (GntR family)